MGQWALKILIDRIIVFIVGLASDWFKTQQAKNRAKKKINEIKKIKDPKSRASSMDDLFK